MVGVRRFTIGLTAALFALGASALGAHAAPAMPKLSATTAALIDADSGQLLYGLNAHVRRPMASTTKVMTSLMAVESGRLDEVVTVSKRASAIGEASIALKPGEKLTLRELVYGVLLSSGNDASTAVAEYLGDGSEARFVDQMNARASELGLKNTHFANPHGLPGANHYSSAYDLTVMLQEASRLPEWTAMAGAKWQKIPLEGQPDGRVLTNHNKLLWNYPFAGPGKTGYTFAAGRCFVGSGAKNGRRVIEAVMAAPDMWGDSQKLLEYGLNHYENVVMARRGEVLGTVPVAGGNGRTVEVVAPRDVAVTLPKAIAKHAELQQVWQLPSELAPPIDENQPIGQLQIRHGDRTLANVPLVAASQVTVAQASWETFSAWVFPGMIAASVLSVLRLRKPGPRRRRRPRPAAGRPAPPSKPVPLSGRGPNGPVPPKPRRGLTGRLRRAS